jgi:hypothetical protein
VTWIFNHTAGSVLIAALFHSATDAAIPYFNVMTGDVALFWLFVAVQWAAALLVVAVEGAGYLSRDRVPAGATFGQPAAVVSAPQGVGR